VAQEVQTRVRTSMRYLLWASFAAVLLACGPSAPASSAGSATTASSRSTVRAIERVFRAPQADARWFAPSFLEECPIERMQDVLDVVRDTVGEVQGVRGNGDDYVGRFSAGEKNVRAKLDEQGRFVVLLIGPG
jgi:hypothetical protein